MSWQSPQPPLPGNIRPPLLDRWKQLFVTSTSSAFCGLTSMRM